MKSLFNTAVLLYSLAGVAAVTRAQEAVPPPMPAYQLLSGAQLDQLLEPIALHPDPLLAQILAASTLPAQIVLADRYLSGGGDPNEIDQQPWDSSVQALARYPNVLQWMDQNLAWTTEVGDAFMNQQPDVMDSIQRLRQLAYNLGNLQSTPQEQVINDGGYIEIVPVNPLVIYVPVYQPDQVYDQAANGGVFISFGAGFPIGPWLDCDFDWGHHNVIVWNRDHPRPANWWREPSIQRDPGQATIWRFENRSRPATVNYGDRGWGVPNRPVVVATVSRSFGDSAAPRRAPTPALRPGAPAPVGNAQPVIQPESNGAFIGIQSSRETRIYSQRGHQSMQPPSHSAPGSHPAPVSHPGTPSGGGRGGGGHSSGSPTRH